ncbi:MAG: hypothetical protein AB2784_21490 [Candidatus Thiodiazotropha endolucinida]
MFGVEEKEIMGFLTGGAIMEEESHCRELVTKKLRVVEMELEIQKCKEEIQHCRDIEKKNEIDICVTHDIIKFLNKKKITLEKSYQALRDGIDSLSEVRGERK